MKTLITMLVCFVTFGSFPSLGQPGSLDIDFSFDGKVTTDFGSDFDQGSSVAIQPDGKILVAGLSGSGSYPDYPDFAVARYNTDGSPDNTFGTGGKVTTEIGSGDDRCWSVAIQSDGKILVAGHSDNGTDDDFALVRYNTNGSLDSPFSTDGKVTTSFGSADDIGSSVAIQSNGKIVLAGSSDNGSDNDFALVRYNTDGSLDNSFGVSGKVTTAIGSGDDFGWSAAIQSDGKILVAGRSHNGTDFDFALVRYNANGIPDNSFGADGKVTTDFFGNTDFGYSVAIQPDGKILVAGSSLGGTNFDFVLARHNADGTLDNSFGAGGKVTTDFFGNTDIGYSVAIQPDGKIVVAGHSYIISNWDFAVVRYNTDGSFDNIFGTNGKVTTDFE